MKARRDETQAARVVPALASRPVSPKPFVHFPSAAQAKPGR